MTCLIILGIIVFIIFRCCNTVPDFSHVKPLKKRVVVMHSNVLYSDVNKDPGAHGSIVPFLPQVKIEGARGWLASELTSASEYEIPLDKEWEFPREK